MNLSEIASKQPEIVLLVHGTFAFDDNDEAAPNSANRWWQRSSNFCRRFQDTLGSDYAVAADSVTAGTAGTDPKPLVFHWSGDNSERHRRLAGKLLLEQLQALEAKGRAYHLVAHSHGGSLLWETLVQATAQQPPSADNSNLPLPNLKSWTTVGSPFLHFVPDLTGAAAAIPAACLMTVFFWQFAWFADFWEQFSVSSSASWPSKIFAVGVSWLIVLIAIPIVAHFLWRLYRAIRSEEDPRPKSEVPRDEWQRFRTACWSAATVSLVAAGLGWRTFIAKDTASVASEALSSLQAWGASAWLLLAFIGAAASLWAVAWPLYQMVSCYRRKQGALESWNLFGKKYRGFACHQSDEAILGLNAIVRGLKGPLLPRLRPPGAGVYSSQHGRLRRPETRRHNVLSLASLAIGLSILRDWILRGPYNEVMAKLTDAFVLRKLSRDAQGADIPGLMLGQVSITPVPVAASEVGTTGRLRDWWVGKFVPSISADTDQTAACWHGPSAAVCSAIQQQTERHAAEFLRHLRIQLGVATPSAQSIPDFLTRAMSGDADAVEMLVHTQYFDNPKFVQELADSIRDVPTDVGRFPPDIGAKSPSGGATVGVEHAEDGASDFIWWTVRGLVIAVILVLPAAALWQLGRFALYPSSRQFNLDWASSTPAAIAAAAPRMGDVGRFSERGRSPDFARWLSILIAVGRDEAANEFFEAMSRLTRDPFEIAVVEAVVAEKLLELGDAARAREVMRSAVARSSPQPSTSDDELRKARVERAKCVVLGGCEQPHEPTTPKKRVPISNDVDALWAFVDEAANNQPSAPGVAPLADRVRTAVEKLSGVQEPREHFAALNVVLILHQMLLDSGRNSDAEAVIVEAEKICRYLDGLRHSFADDEMAVKVIDSLVICAKSQRFNRDDAVRMLNLAEEWSRSGLQPGGEVQALARVGAGFARLGYFQRARKLSASADPGLRLLVAKEILANEFERQRHGLPLSSTATQEIAQAYGQLRRAADEQVDPLRGEYDGFR